MAFIRIGSRSTNVILRNFQLQQDFYSRTLIQKPSEEPPKVLITGKSRCKIFKFKKYLKYCSRSEH